MKTPRFWSERSGLSTWLLPLSVIYEIVSVLSRQGITPKRVNIPVICIGNLTAGGAGKTPVALAIGEKLAARGVKAFYLTRGYGGKQRGPLLVDPTKHTAADVGDEPLLLAKILPTVIARDRAAGAAFAMAQGARALIMDDGFQNRTLAKTLSLLVIDGKAGFGNGRLLPAGPLREVPELGFPRAHAVVVINDEGGAPPIPDGKPILKATTMALPDDALKGRRLIAFCGLGQPQKFFDSLRKLGAELLETHAFADHHHYRHNELRKLRAAAKRENALLVTTAKDAVRLPAEFLPQVHVIVQSLQFENEMLLDTLLGYALKP